VLASARERRTARFGLAIMLIGGGSGQVESGARRADGGEGVVEGAGEGVAVRRGRTYAGNHSMRLRGSQRFMNALRFCPFCPGN
jgi:hypothetical protein